MIAGQVPDIARKLVGNNKIIKTWGFLPQFKSNTNVLTIYIIIAIVHSNSKLHQNLCGIIEQDNIGTNKYL